MLPTSSCGTRSINLYMLALKAKPESFAAFKKEMASPNFNEELEKARDNPKSIREQES